MSELGIFVCYFFCQAVSVPAAKSCFHSVPVQPVPMLGAPVQPIPMLSTPVLPVSIHVTPYSAYLCGSSFSSI